MSGEGLYVVQGRRASLNEYNEALALGQLRIKFIFQYELFGGAGSLPGGLSVDFVTLPWLIPIEVKGEAWHSGLRAALDVVRENRIYAALGRKPITLWGRETMTVDLARAATLREYRAPR